MGGHLKKIPGPYGVAECHSPLPHYDRKPEYDKMKQDRDVMVRMLDGVRLCVDIYRPDAPGKFPARRVRIIRNLFFTTSAAA